MEKSKGNGTANGKGRFSARVMDWPLPVMVSKGMYKKVIEHVEGSDTARSMADYVRKLIMQDLKIDEYGEPTGK